MAEDDDDSQKTEDPSQKRLSDEKEKGNLPVSRDLATWVILLGIVLSSVAILPSATKDMMRPLRAIIEKSGELSIADGGFSIVLGEIFGAFIWPVLLISVVLFIMGIVGWQIQTGMMFNMSMLTFNLSKLNPMEGFKRIFSVNSIVELLKNVAKLIVIGVISYSIIKPVFLSSEGMTGMDNLAMVSKTFDISTHILFMIFLIFTLIAGVDIIYQRFAYFKKLRMSKEELKEEFKQMEGDPQIKSRLRQIRNEKAKRRMMSAVPKADVIITNPTHFAIALKYDPIEMKAPVVLAKGQDFIAQKIRELATEHKVPLVSNPPLARALYATVEIDEEVPPIHYRAVAEVISYIYKLKKIRRS